MKRKKKLFIAIALVLSSVFLIFSFYLFPRVFGDEETKAMYKIKSILNSYINFKSNDLVDFIHHNFNAGFYEYENDKLKLSLRVETDEDIIDVLSEVSSLCNEIKAYINNNSGLNDKKVDITVRIEHWAEWSMVLEPNSNHICIGLNDRMSITQILSYCKEFEIIDIGGYWGYYVSIPNDIDSDFFADFPVLKVLRIIEIDTSEMEKRLNEAVSGLREKGVEVITEVRQSYQKTGHYVNIW